MIARKIIKQRRSLSSKLKCLIRYAARVRGAKLSWEKRHEDVINVNTDYKTPCSAAIEKKHQDLWSPFRKKCDLTTLRICKNISGVCDSRFIPEDVFVSDIEPTLITDTSVDYIGIKSFYNRWFDKGIFPDDIFHRVDGQYLDASLNPIQYQDLEIIAKELNYPVVLKPNKDTYGGKNIEFPANKEELLRSAKGKSDFVVQKIIQQNKFFDTLNNVGLNTVKIFVYRSVKDNKVHVLSMALRMGQGGALDNEAAGGIVTFINQNGVMNGYATDKHGSKYIEHPDTKVTFSSKLPDYEKLKSLAIKVGQNVFYTRIMGLDACYDNTGKWRILEVNTFSQSIRFSQYGGVPFFGDFTDEVIQYCLENHWALKQ